MHESVRGIQFPLFSRLTYRLCNDLASIRTTTRAVLDAFAADGVVYLELRTTPRSQPGTAMSKPAYVEAVLDAIDAHQPSPMQTRLILSVDRRDSPAAAHECVDLAIRYRARGVVGVDLCGDPLVHRLAPPPSLWLALLSRLTLSAASTSATPPCLAAPLPAPRPPASAPPCTLLRCRLLPAVTTKPRC